MPDKQLAVIKHATFGMIDGYKLPCLRLQVTIPESWSTDLAIPGAESFKVFQESGVCDVGHLVGKLCWIQDTDGVAQFLSYCKV